MLESFTQTKARSFTQIKMDLRRKWLDESTTHKYLNKEIATNVLNVVDLESCPDHQEVFIFMGSIDNGDAVKVGRYSIAVMSIVI